jgi:hypothetical protein
MLKTISSHQYSAKRNTTVKTVVYFTRSNDIDGKLSTIDTPEYYFQK